MNDKSISISDEIMRSKIFLIRGQKVMLDSDLAELYGVETKVLNQAVKRNQVRFPEDFMFKLTDLEYESLRSQFVTLKIHRGSHTKYLPSVFSEHGILMLSSVLHSLQAIHVNIQLMRIFTRIRTMLTDDANLRSEIEKIKNKLNNNDANIELVFSYLDELMTKKHAPRKRIGFMPDDL